MVKLNTKSQQGDKDIFRYSAYFSNDMDEISSKEFIRAILYAKHGDRILRSHIYLFI